MRDGPAGGGEQEALLVSVEQGAAAFAAADDEALPLSSAVARALAELLHPGTPVDDGADAGADDWRSVLGGVHRCAEVLADTHPASWTLATSSGALLGDWVGSGAWAGALRAALVRAGAGAGAVRDAPLVVALHLFAVRPQVAGVPGAVEPSGVLAAYPHVTRLRALLAAPGSTCEPGGPGALAVVECAVEELLR